MLFILWLVTGWVIYYKIMWRYLLKLAELYFLNKDEFDKKMDEYKKEHIQEFNEYSENIKKSNDN